MRNIKYLFANLFFETGELRKRQPKMEQKKEQIKEARSKVIKDHYEQYLHGRESVLPISVVKAELHKYLDLRKN